MAINRGGLHTVTGQGEPEAVASMRASASFLPIFGLSPIVGRGFAAGEDDVAAAPTVILSEPYWRSRFGADPSVVGRTLLIDDEPHTIVGVVPAPSFLSTVQLWVPLRWTAADRAVRENHNYWAVAKLAPGVSIERAQADLDLISERLAEQYPADNKDWGALVVALQDDLVGEARPALLVLLGAVALVLLIACANLANLMLLRTYGRAREIALRGALGASRLRVVQQLMAEGVVLGIGGGIAGLLAAVYGVNALIVVFGTALPRAQEVVVDGRVLAFTAAIAIAAGIFSAFAPAWQLTGRDAASLLKEGAGRGTSSARDGRVRTVLVVSEVALALVLLIGAGLLMRSLTSLRAVDPGFDASNTLTGLLLVPDRKYDTPEARNQFFRRVSDSVRALPGVESAAWIDSLPLQGGSSQYVVPEGAPPMQASELPVVAVRLTSPGYFATSRIQLLAGRDFTDADDFGRPGVIVVSEMTARRFWPQENPLGKHVTLSMMSNDPREVVGVVREVKSGSLDASASESETAIYAPAAQFGFNFNRLVVRMAGPPDRLTKSVLAAVAAIDPALPVLEIQTMQQVVEESLGQRPTAMMLLATFAVLALLLASVGIYSVLAYAVGQRVREIGIRMALGAPSSGVLRLIVLDGLKPTIAGVVLGLVLATILVRAMAALLFGVSPHDLGTFTAVSGLVLLVGVVATLIPAYRATRVDPIDTLRAE
jgi:predicted permease